MQSAEEDVELAEPENLWARCDPGEAVGPPHVGAGNEAHLRRGLGSDEDVLGRNAEAVGLVVDAEPVAGVLAP
ncbi:MAG: hypothetical protein GTN78_11910 [Gemmatimonadales bacterium]|nr:hypothetical protein [Gemmatimonadales bacterium]NIR00887.1 hypothetical protein [Gemmatimonadales bacterium]NIS65027.1 hypothetical protein [Gemmatimonadales bacterium]